MRGPCALLALLALLAPVVAAPAGTAAPPAPASGEDRLRLESVFQYQAPAAAHPWRAALEIGAGITFQFLNYISNPSGTAVTGDETHSPIDKLFHGSFSFDANSERTNFAGHPLAGAFYYQVARGNRLSTWASTLAAVAGSTVWELTEYHETASVNDMVVTPVAGVAIGEPLAQLSAFFEQRDAGTGDRVLAWLAHPLKKGHDWWDGARVARRPEALARHDFRLAAAGGAALRGGAWSPQARASLDAALIRARGYGEAGRGTRSLLDGNAVRLSMALAASADGLDEGRFESDAVLAGLSWRDLEGQGEPRGQDLLLGAGLGFEWLTRRLAASGRPDWLSLVHVPGLRAAWRRLAGPVRVEARLDAALTFGGVRSLVLAGDPAAVPPEDLPTVTRTYGYYFALGAMARPGLALRLGPASLGVEARVDLLRGLTGHDPQPLPGGVPARLEDRSGVLRGRADLAPEAWRGASVGLEAARTWRSGRAGDASRSLAASEVRLAVGLAR